MLVTRSPKGVGRANVLRAPPRERCRQLLQRHRRRRRRRHGGGGDRGSNRRVRRAGESPTSGGRPRVPYLRRQADANPKGADPRHLVECDLRTPAPDWGCRGPASPHEVARSDLPRRSAIARSPFDSPVPGPIDGTVVLADGADDDSYQKSLLDTVSMGRPVMALRWRDSLPENGLLPHRRGDSREWWFEHLIDVGVTVL